MEQVLAVVVDTLRQDAERLGIKFVTTSPFSPTIYYTGDGEDQDAPPPAGWREMLARQCDRLDWPAVYWLLDATRD